MRAPAATALENIASGFGTVRIIRTEPPPSDSGLKLPCSGDSSLSSRLEDLRTLLRDHQRRAPGSLGFSLVLLEHAHNNLTLWQRIAGRESGAFALQRIERLIADLAAADVKALGFRGTDEQRELAVQYIAGAFMAVLSWWVDRGAKLPPPDVDALFRRLVMRGLQGGTSLTARYRAAKRGAD